MSPENDRKSIIGSQEGVLPGTCPQQPNVRGREALSPIPPRAVTGLRTEPYSSQEIAERTLGILDGFQPSSGIKIQCRADDSDMTFLVRAPSAKVDMTDKQLISWIKIEGFSPSHFKDEEAMLENARYMKEREHIGGYEITARDISETRGLCPPIEDMLRAEDDKIVVLGSGFSTLPIMIANMHIAGKFSEPPVIADLLDYGKVQTDFLGLQRRFTEEGLDYPFRLQLSRVTNIVNAIDKRNLVAVQYTVGTGNPPPPLMDASLIVNIFGPPISTVEEQLSMLKLGGRLLTNYDFRLRLFGPGFTSEPIMQLYGNKYSSIITKLPSPST